MVSGHCKDLISFCRSTGFRIVNGRLGDDQDIENFTCYTPAGSSLVDYCLIRERNFELITNFYMGEINTISDHSSLQVHLKIKNKNDNEPTLNQRIRNLWTSLTHVLQILKKNTTVNISVTKIQNS